MLGGMAGGCAMVVAEEHLESQRLLNSVPSIHQKNRPWAFWSSEESPSLSARSGEAGSLR